MKRIKSGWIALLLFAASAMFTNLSYGQGNWNPQQKEVWNNVETYWSILAKGDADGFMSYFGDSYMGWDYDSPVPGNKASTSKYIANGVKNSKTLFYDITPVAIMIYGDIAIVDYYYNQQTQGMGADAKPKWSHGRWTDILQKQGTKWVLIADHGGEMRDKD